MWHVGSRSGVATLRSAIHLLLTYLLTYSRHAGLFTTADTRIYFVVAWQCSCEQTRADVEGGL